MPAPTRPNLTLNSSFLFDAIIVGAGPAGLSAALALCRMKRPAVVFSTTEFRNSKAHRAHTILSRDHQNPAEIRKIAKEQIDAYGTTHFVQRAIVKARKDEEANIFEVQDEQGESWRGKRIVLAMGAKDIFPENIEGYADCWGHDIWQCMFCDGIERSDHPAGMLGFDSPMNLHNILFMFQFGCQDVTIFFNGPKKEMDAATSEALEVAKAKGAKIDERRIKKLIHHVNDEGMDITFENRESTRIGFLVHQPPTDVPASNLAKDLGVEILPDGRQGTILKRNEPFGESNVPGVFVAGDAGVIMKQFTVAMTNGVAAGAGVCFQLGQEEEQQLRKKFSINGQANR